MTVIYTFIILSGFWILLSGKFDLFHLALGAICCLLVSFLSHDLLFSPERKKRDASIPIRFILYLPWLLFQILLANFHVARLALHPKMRKLIDPKMIQFHSKLKGDVARVTFANSITLTPGTITVKIKENEFYVHALSQKTASSLPGDMEKRIARVFGEE